MKYRRLGNSGLFVSSLGLGTNSFGSRADEATSRAILNEAMEAGINFIDTANVYSKTKSEEIIGKALRESGRRHDVVLATKVGMPRGRGVNQGGSSRREILEQMDASLTRLQTDYVDLYQIHTFDPNTPLEETLEALHSLVQMGKVRYIGASNYAAWELMKALAVSDRHQWPRFVSVQPCYSLADRTVELELEPLCLDQGIGIIPYYPLAGGILTGKYTNGQMPSGSRVDTDPTFERRLDKKRLELGDAILNIANERQCSPSSLALAWLMHRVSVATIIVGATRPAQVHDNLASVSLHLDDATIEKLDELSAPFRYSEPFATFRPIVATDELQSL